MTLSFLPFLNKLGEVHLKVLEHDVQLLIFDFDLLCVNDVRVFEYLEHLQFSLLHDFIQARVGAIELLDCYYFPCLHIPALVH